MALRIVFFGTPDFSVPTLSALAASAHTVVGVVTQPDRPRGRGHKVTPGPVKVTALALGLPVLQPDRLRDETFLSAFDAWGADLGVVAAYGKLLPQLLIDRPRLGMVNVHASLLPRWRGAAPIHRAILAGDAVTGITIMRVVLALDAGPMLSAVRVTIEPNQTSVELEHQLAQAGAALLTRTVNALAAGATIETPQDEAGVTYAHRLGRADSQITWTRTAREIHDQIRGLHPWPLAAAMLAGSRIQLIESRIAEDEATLPAAGEGTIVHVAPEGLLVATGLGRLHVTRVQPEGRAKQSIRDFLNGRRVVAGDRFEPLPA